MKKYIRFTQRENYEIIRMVTRNDLSTNRTLKEIGLHRRTFYNWHAMYLEDRYDGLAPRTKNLRKTWNKIPQQERN